jgi:murein DD-endopeptidase MepM/ murein hydrolase activator NlpD
LVHPIFKLMLSGLALGALPVSAAQASSGGLEAPEKPVVSGVTCATGEAWRCSPGMELVITGRHLEAAQRVVFLGRRGRRDDRVATKLVHAGDRLLTVTVPPGARTGPVRAATPKVGTGVSRRAVRVVRRGHTVAPAPPARDLAPGEPLVAGSASRMRLDYDASATRAAEAVNVETGAVARRWELPAGAGTVRWDGTDGTTVVPAGRYALRIAASGASAAASTPAIEVRDALFPIRGKHDLGQSETNNFGGGRGHQGQDMFAACGTPLAAVRPGTVQFVGTQERAGNYAVLQDATGQSYVYMHMRDPSPLVKGQRIVAGQAVGLVGDTGRASGCHLHFELWTSPGWYEGGQAIDGLPELRRWDLWG